MRKTIEKVCFWLMTAIAIITTLCCAKLDKQIQTQKEYIQCLENENWEQFVELENYKENEYLQGR